MNMIDTNGFRSFRAEQREGRVVRHGGRREHGHEHLSREAWEERFRRRRNLGAWLTMLGFVAILVLIAVLVPVPAAVPR